MTRLIKKFPWLSKVMYFFPVRLLFVQLKKNPVLLFFWFMLYGFISGLIASNYGIYLLFLDPEYLGEVSFMSYFFVGFASGGFIMAYQIASYIYNAYRFPFLATLSNPFLRYCNNNFIVPFIFQAYYVLKIILFLHDSGSSITEIFTDTLGFISGNIVFITGSLFYFFRTGTNLEKIYGSIGKTERKERVKKVYLKQNTRENKLEWKTITPGKEERDWHVETYLSANFSIRRARPFEHYDKELLNMVFRQNHIRAVYFELAVIITLVVFGLFRNNPLFIIPAGASILLLFTLYLMFSGILRTWFRGWTNAVLIVLLLLINWIYGLDVFNNHTRAYGLNYTLPPVTYNNQVIAELASDKIRIEKDSLNTVKILNNWLKKNEGSDTIHKPSLVILNCSGGGIRSALWTFTVLRHLDSLSKGDFLNHTALVCGSSGGMIGAAYMRELMLRNPGYQERCGKAFDANISGDILNPVALSIAVNDWFFPLQRFTYNGSTYSRNRASAFEEQLHINTNGVLEKTLNDYSIHEKNATIPMMIFSPTIVNDGRKLLISSSPVSYLAAVPGRPGNAHIDAVEYSALFKSHGAMDTRFSSVLRMNATFPYVTPLTELPTSPQTEVFDAGMRDNYGVDNTLRFLYTFRKWLEENTSGVIIVQLRDKFKQQEFGSSNAKSLFGTLSRPMGSFYGNLFGVQDYNNDRELDRMIALSGVKISIYNLELKNEEKDMISLSWHLTKAEKMKVKNSLLLPSNQKTMSALCRQISR